MSYPPPPGLKSSSSTPLSLPARPPPSTATQPPSYTSSTATTVKPAFTAFAPRSVASATIQRPTNSTSAHYSAAPVTAYNATPTYASPQTSSYPTNHPPNDTYGSGPQIRNPFVPVSGAANSSLGPPGYDAEYEAQIQQWQSAYIATDKDKNFMRRDGIATANPTAPIVTPRNETSTPAVKTDGPAKTVQRSGGGTNWTDSSLLEWDPAHFRIFVGNLAGEVTDESLLKAFSKYPSVQKARVIRDKRTTKSRGYGFVSFSDGDDYFQAARDMQGKYIGSHPVLIKRSTTEVRATNTPQQKGGKYGKHNKNRNDGGAGYGKVEQGGIQKKQPKTKGGLKVLG